MAEIVTSLVRMCVLIKYYNFCLIISRRDTENIRDEDDSTLEVESHEVRGYTHSTIG